MKLTYDVGDKPKFSQTLIFAFQQIIAIMAATLLVPILMSGYDTGYVLETLADGSNVYAHLSFDPAAALFGAGIGTIVYILFSRRKSPVFLGSSFTFLGAYAAVIGSNYGWWGVLIGIALAGLVYVIFAIIIKLVGSKWVNKIMPAVIIGPIVTLIGLSLSGTATGWLSGNGGGGYSLVTIVVGLFTFFMIVVTSIYGSKNLKLIPFIIGIGSGFLLALVLSVIGNVANVEALKIMDFTAINAWWEGLTKPNGALDVVTSFVDVPKFTFLKALGVDYFLTEADKAALPHILPINGAAIANIAMTFVPIGVVELAQHIGDHKNLGSIINRDLITDPGLDKTLLGDGIGSIVGGFFGGAANTTYGESIGCVAITGNASIVSIFTAAVGCMILSFLTPFVVIINSIPKCVMGGACLALYGFIAVSGLQMIKKVDLGNNKNLFVVSAILVTGIGGLTLNFGTNPTTGGAFLTVSALATALIVGLVTNLIANGGKIGSGEDTGNDGLASSVENLGNAEFEDINKKK